MNQPIPPHRTLMLLHRLVDRALAPLLEPMQLEHATEGYVAATRADIDGLVSAHGDPQSVLVDFGPGAGPSGLLVAEPSLSSAILARIWRSDRNAGAPLTQVEGEILRQFLARLVGAWADSWRTEGLRVLPDFSMAGALSMLAPHLADSPWQVARTVVREPGRDEPVGVLLFCYPEALLPKLADEAGSILWRSRVRRGLGDGERETLQARLAGPLRDVAITAPVQVRQTMTLGTLNSLERGDVLALDETAAGAIRFQVLGREVLGRLGQTAEGRLALSLGDATDAVGAAPGAAAHEQQYAGVLGGGPGAHPPHADDFEYDEAPDPSDWSSTELAS